MNLFEFEQRLIKRHGINRYVNYLIGVTVIIFGIICLQIRIDSNNLTALLFKAILIIFMSGLGIYSIIATRNQGRPWKWVNTLSKKENIQLVMRIMASYKKKPGTVDPDYQRFLFKNKWWQLSYDVHLFAGENMIAVKADSTRGGNGIVDLGASRRLEKKIIARAQELMEEDPERTG